MGPFFGIIGLLGTVVFAILLIVHAIRKTGQMKRWAICLVIAFACLILGFALTPSNSTPTAGSGTPAAGQTNTPTTPEPPKADFSLTASKLYGEYKSNQVAADQKYKGKLLEVSGTVADIGKDIIDRIYVTLKTDDALGSVQVFFPDKAADSIAKLQKGDSLTVQGKCTGLAIINVVLEDSTLIK